MKLSPAANIIFGFLGYVIAGLALKVTISMGINIPPDIASMLPGAVGLTVAHGWDVWTGDNKPK